MPYELRLAVFFILVLLLAGCNPAQYSMTSPNQTIAGAGGSGNNGGLGGGDDGGSTGGGGEVIDQPNLEDALDDPDLLDQHACSNGSNAKSVFVCHLPPGNPEEFHTICISVEALRAHIDLPHGSQPDILGDCRDAF